MSTFPNAVLQSMADVMKAGPWLSLHTANPGTTGASPVAGVARVQTTWTSNGDGTITGTEVLFENVPAGTVTHVGQWDSSTGGTFKGGEALDTPIVLNAPGDVKITPSGAVTAAA